MLFRKQRNEFFESLTGKGFVVGDFVERFDNSNKYEVLYSKDQRFKLLLLDSMSSGAFITQITNLALSPEHVSAVAHLIKTTFFGLLGLN